MQSISSTLNIQIFHTNVRFSSFYYVHVTRKKLPKWCLYEKFEHFTLMKLTPTCSQFCAFFISIHLTNFFLPKYTKKNWKNITAGVDFTNIFFTAFMCADPKSAKNTVKLSVFCAFGICLWKILRKMLIKLTTLYVSKSVIIKHGFSINAAVSGELPWDWIHYWKEGSQLLKYVEANKLASYFQSNNYPLTRTIWLQT